MKPIKPNDSLEVRIARIDERLENLHSQMPALIQKVTDSQRDILAAKVVAGVAMILMAVKFPQLAEVLSKVIP